MNKYFIINCMRTLQQLFCLIRVAELKSFTLAAEALCITPTAVSKQIKNLEKEIDEQLFQRHTREVKLTEFGEHAYAQAKKIVAQIDSFDNLVESKKTTPQGNLRVLVSTILAKQFVVDHLAEFLKQYPGIHCELFFSEQDSDLNREDIDVMVGFPQIPPYTDNLKYRKIDNAKNILCAAPSLIQHYGMPSKTSDLMNLPFISHSLRKPATQLRLADGNTITCPAPLLFMDNFDALNQACINGVGIFLTGDVLVKQELETQQLIHLLPQLQFTNHEIYLFYRHYNYELPKIRAFIDFYSIKL